MHTHDRTSRYFALGLAMLAGFVDALGFLTLGGVFVSFMSGNSTRFSVGITGNAPLYSALLPLAIIVLFLIGVILGKVVRHYSRRHPCTSLLIFMSGCLLFGAFFYQAGIVILAAPFMAIAMGAANNVFVKEGEVSIGVTYMTGTLVKLGQHLAGHFLGEPQRQWAPYLLLWLALILGAILGAACFHYFNLSGLWIAAIFCTVLTLAARKLDSKSG